MEKKFYTTGEIAKITGISQKTIKNYCTQGRIKSEKTLITNYRRISRQSLVQFLEENSISSDILNAKPEIKILVTDDDKKIVRL
ncbi:MAG: helix-turn-helix domain-containing protein, partial [Fibrobacterota bacterium]